MQAGRCILAAQSDITAELVHGCFRAASIGLAAMAIPAASGATGTSACLLSFGVGLRGWASELVFKVEGFGSKP